MTSQNYLDFEKRMKDFYSHIEISPDFDLIKPIKEKTISKTSVHKHGTVGLMCPYCYNVFYALSNGDSNHTVVSDNATLNILIHTKYNIGKCNFCGEYDVDLIELDPNIAMAISIFNKKGYTTKFCCEGHPERNCDNGYIYFNGRSIIKYIDLLPISWYLDLRDIRSSEFIYGYIIRYESFNKAEAMYDILEFANMIE